MSNKNWIMCANLNRSGAMGFSEVSVMRSSLGFHCSDLSRTSCLYSFFNAKLVHNLDLEWFASPSSSSSLSPSTNFCIESSENRICSDPVGLLCISNMLIIGSIAHFLSTEEEKEVAMLTKERTDWKKWDGNTK